MLPTCTAWITENCFITIFVFGIKVSSELFSALSGNMTPQIPAASDTRILLKKAPTPGARFQYGGGGGGRSGVAFASVEMCAAQPHRILSLQFPRALPNISTPTPKSRTLFQNFRKSKENGVAASRRLVSAVRECLGILTIDGMCGRWIFVGVLLVTGGDALKDVSVTIPPAVKIMDTVTLQCRYDLQGEQLYTVKWYKGQKEFFRYIPKELPSTQVFPLPGINVDLSKSSSNEVVLRNVQPEVTGRFKCEVSSDAPNFYTFIVSGYMYVIDVPEEDPVMTFEKDLLEMGYTVRGNCTSPPSYPPVNITWLLNGKKINASSLKHIPVPNAIVTDSRRQPHITQSALELEIDSNTFEGGKARLQCVASLFHLYKREVELIVEEEKPRPRPSSELRTRDAADGGQVQRGRRTLLLVALLLVGLR
ncbi:uncharacterized protein LOC135124812 [Zophobas morio]|uniref:uncharacterized protein LOC135124812 n=1 Tax=Zophobas morio TaxID=2755281 RepID=UPI00308310EA